MRVIVDVQCTVGCKTGIGHYTSELVRCLQKQRTRHEVIDTYPGSTYPGMLLKWAGVVLPRRRLFGTGVITKLVESHRQACLRRRNYDLYHEPNFIPALADCPTITTLHDLSVLHHPEWHPPVRVAHFERYFLPRLPQAQHYLAISDAAREEIIRTLNIPPARITRTYMGVRPHLRPLPPDEIAEARTRLGLPPRYLLCVGTIEPRKNVLRLMQAYCGLPAPLRERWPLLLVGQWGWNTQPIAEFYDNYARHRGVKHLGYVPERDLAALYNGARALLYPSLYEGFGMPPLEMMACGGAVIASTAEAVAEVAAPCAALLAAEDEVGWRDAMQRVITDDEWWESLRAGAVEQAKPFTWERCAAETLRVYRAACAAPCSKPAPALAA